MNCLDGLVMNLLTCYQLTTEFVLRFTHVQISFSFLSWTPYGWPSSIIDNVYFCLLYMSGRLVITGLRLLFSSIWVHTSLLQDWDLNMYCNTLALLSKEEKPTFLIHFDLHPWSNLHKTFLPHVPIPWCCGKFVRIILAFL